MKLICLPQLDGSLAASEARLDALSRAYDRELYVEAAVYNITDNAETLAEIAEAADKSLAIKLVGDIKADLRFIEERAS